MSTISAQIVEQNVMKRAFTLVEVMIVVAILGILAAIVMPTFQNSTAKAKESAAKENLQALRIAIARYAIDHNDIPPGYQNGNPSLLVLNSALHYQLIGAGNYLHTFPENPFNGSVDFDVIADDETFPTEPTGDFGWVYQPATKTIKLNSPGTDSDDVAYFDY